MDALHTAGIHFAEALQAGPPWLEKFWIWVTSLADPKCIFTIGFPLAYFLDRKVGVSVLWIGLVSEWLNVVLKWFLFGERPFWWVHESGLTRTELVTLRQFAVSCETGPGSPSGHCMITGAALWPLVTALTALASRHSRSLVVKLSPFGAYTLLLLAVGLSRVFVLAHFPHQVVGGILAGEQGWGGRTFGPSTQSPTPTLGPGYFGHLPLLSSSPIHRGTPTCPCLPCRGSPGLGAAGSHPGHPHRGLLRGRCAGPAARLPRPAQPGDSCRHRHRLVHPLGHQMVLQPRLAAPRHPALRLHLPGHRQRPGAGAGCCLPPAPGGAAGTPAARGQRHAGPGGHAGLPPAPPAHKCDPVVRHQLLQVRCWALAGDISPALACPLPRPSAWLPPCRLGVPTVSRKGQSFIPTKAPGSITH
ncbi:glucose-6-phosphatase 3 isoform 4-T4 [Alca torda]